MTTAKRSISIKDLLIIILATSIGFAGIRFYLQDEDIEAQLKAILISSRLSGQPQDSYSLALGNRLQLMHIANSTICLLVSWTLALLFFGLRRSNPPLRRMLDKPGIAACLAVSLMFSFGVLKFLLSFLFHLLVGINNFYWLGWREIIKQLGDQAGPSVVTVWAILAVERRCRFERGRGWLDLLGLVLGFVWILIVFRSTAVIAITRMP